MTGANRTKAQEAVETEKEEVAVSSKGQKNYFSWLIIDPPIAGYAETMLPANMSTGRTTNLLTRSKESDDYEDY